MTSLPKNVSSVDVHSSSSCSKPIYVLSFMREKEIFRRMFSIQQKADSDQQLSNSKREKCFF